MQTVGLSITLSPTNFFIIKIDDVFGFRSFDFGKII